MGDKMSKPIRNQSIRCKPIYVFIIIFILQFCYVPALYSEEEKIKDDETKNNIFNLYDSELGRVSKEGIIYNQHGRKLGSVDDEGNIYNISKINIGKVDKDGTVFNQSDTKLGSVNENGEIFNRGASRVGQVKDLKDIKLIGGAARLIFFRKK
jgi:hypothetical protein